MKKVLWVSLVLCLCCAGSAEAMGVRSKSSNKYSTLVIAFKDRENSLQNFTWEAEEEELPYAFELMLGSREDMLLLVQKTDSKEIHKLLRAAVAADSPHVVCCIFQTNPPNRSSCKEIYQTALSSSSQAHPNKNKSLWMLGAYMQEMPKIG